MRDHQTTVGIPGLGGRLWMVALVAVFAATTAAWGQTKCAGLDCETTVCSNPVKFNPGSEFPCEIFSEQLLNCPEAILQTGTVGIWPSGTPEIKGARAFLLRGCFRAYTYFETTVEPNHAYQVWAGIWDQPQNCEGPCDTPDTCTPEAGWRIIWAGSSVSDSEGRLVIRGRTNCPGVGVPPDKILVGSQNGLTNIEGAHFSLMLTDHGEVSTDASECAAQLCHIVGGSICTIPNAWATCCATLGCHHNNGATMCPIVQRAIFAPPSLCRGDINVNGEVNVDDLLLVINAWNFTGGPADIHTDCSVNVTDLLSVINAWGPCE